MASRPAPSRLAGPAFVVIVLVSLVVLFWPSGGGELPFPESDKLVHLLLFACLAAATRWRFGLGVAVVVAYAPVSELIQALALPRRSGDLLDVVADLAGVALGWLVCGRLLRRL